LRQKSIPCRGRFGAFSLAVDGRSRLDGGRSGDQQLRILAIMALTLALVGCTGDRIKQGMNSPQGSVVKSVSQSAAWSSSG
jgi:hypothetical protein